MKEFCPMLRGLLILLCATLLGGCINVTIDPTKPIEVHAVVDVNVKSADKKPSDVFGEEGQKPAAPEAPTAKPVKP
jgi:hypothetical protein